MAGQVPLRMLETARLTKLINPIRCTNCYGLKDMPVNPQDVSDENQISHCFYLPERVIVLMIMIKSIIIIYYS